MSGNTAQFYKPATKSEINVAMRRVLYLGTVEKVRVALANEFSPDTPLPSAKTIQRHLDERKGKGPRNMAQRRVTAV